MPDSRDPSPEDEHFRAGLQVRREVLGADNGNKAMQEPNGFTQFLQEVVTKSHGAWSGQGLA
jgi:hypothetical protein